MYDFFWAQQFPEVHKVCSLFQLRELNNPIRYSYKSLEQYTQEGPQCGLVALAMCEGSIDKCVVETLLQIAKDENYTYNGEIFSVSYMLSLAQQYLTNYDVESYSGVINSEEIREHLLGGGLVLVPYDTDKDNSPGMHNGHKAHWAVLTGAIETREDFFVLARHGKAKNVAIWNVQKLSDSNMQLNEFSADRKLSNVDYKLPEDGINGQMGLKNKAILLKPKPQKERN